MTAPNMHRNITIKRSSRLDGFPVVVVAISTGTRWNGMALSIGLRRVKFKNLVLLMQKVPALY